MNPGRAFSLLTGVALLGAIAQFNEMTPDAQASLLGEAAGTARTAAQSLLSNAVATYNQMTGGTDTTPDTPAQRVPAAPRAGDGVTGDATPARRIAARSLNAEPESGNPLWALPLKQLSMTRDRPIFSPSRRPPPPPMPAFVAPVAVRQAPVKPAEPERPTVTLLGTIIGSSTDDRIGVFLDTATQTVVRLRVGEDHHGWVLRLVKARETTLVKSGEQAVVLEMPTPGDAAMAGMGGMPGMPPGVVPPGIVPPPGGMPPAYQNAIANGTLPGPAPPAQGGRQRRQR
jgi:general secretion pathway protein N